jgi:NADH-quinone oxidoreductase subunit C
MTPNDIFTRIQSQFPGISFKVQQGAAGDSWLLAPPDQIIPTLTFLKATLGFTFLSCLGGIDYISTMGVVYVVRSLENKCQIIIKALLSHETPEIASASGLYGNADWFEREAYDLFGIKFIGHPNLRRIMMPDDWVGHPMRKDYVEAAEYHGISTTRPNSHEVLNHLYPAKPTAETDSPAKPV